MATLRLDFMKRREGKLFENSTVKTVVLTNAHKLPKGCHEMWGYQDKVVYFCQRCRKEKNPYGDTFVIKDGSHCEIAQCNTKDYERLAPATGYDFIVCKVF